MTAPRQLTQAPLTREIEVRDEYGQRRHISIPAERALARRCEQLVEDDARAGAAAAVDEAQSRPRQVTHAADPENPR